MKTLQLTLLAGISLFVGFNAFGVSMKHDSTEFDKNFQGDTAVALSNWQAGNKVAALTNLNTIGTKINADRTNFKRQEYQRGFIMWLNNHLDILGRHVDSFNDAMMALTEQLRAFGAKARGLVRETMYNAADSF